MLEFDKISFSFLVLLSHIVFYAHWQSSMKHLELLSISLTCLYLGETPEWAESWVSGVINSWGSSCLWCQQLFTTNAETHTTCSLATLQSKYEGAWPVTDRTAKGQEDNVHCVCWDLKCYLGVSCDHQGCYMSCSWCRNMFLGNMQGL